MLRSDPISASAPCYARWAIPLLIDRRDVVFVALMMQCGVVALGGIGLYFSGPLFWWLAPAYSMLLFAGVIDRFTLMLHCTSHRQLFHPGHVLLNQIIPWVLCPFMGQTPETYFAHHMGMHHVEENRPGDLSSTERFQRDRFADWLRYWARFMAVGLFDLTRYFARKGKRRLLRRVIVGEGVYWIAMALLLYMNSRATLVVFLLPYLVMRTLMMVGNWAQHAFICPDQPGHPLRASITCVGTRYNRRCFNDGYHALHHVMPRCHWTDHPVEFERHLEDYGRNDAVVLRGVDFFQVWLLLMTGRWDRLARAVVQLPGVPDRNHEETVAFLKSRVRPIEPPVPGLSLQPTTSGPL
ncbi:MAG TPA: fatty acid desaturase [Anaeromyxobacteraceae bacterium]|nr:fatty acid desaturase [Anaeromyxobacteraceae bacterium]